MILKKKKKNVNAREPSQISVQITVERLPHTRKDMKGESSKKKK